MSRERSALFGTAFIGLAGAGVLILAAFAVPFAFDWDVDARSDRFGLAPLHGFWQPGVGIGTVPAVLLAIAAVVTVGAWQSMSWRRLLATSYVASLAWLVSLALVRGQTGLDRILAHPTEYLQTARGVTDIGTMLAEYVDRIPSAAADNWPIHIAGHPPGAVLFFIGLVKVGLGGDLAAALVVCALAASIPAAVLVTLRLLGASEAARTAAPFLVFSPAAVFLAVSADAVFTALAAWGLAALACAATRQRTGPLIGWSVVAGLLLGWCVMSSYGLPLLGLLAVGVLVAARTWRPLPGAALAALVVVGGFALAGFSWWEAYPVLVDRYWDGIASTRPFAYWGWGNLAALLISGGPALGAGIAVASRTKWRPLNPVLVLVAAAALTIVIADLTRMSKAEVERIWLPFIPWLTLSLTLLPSRLQRWALALQVATALVVEHLLFTTW